MVLHLPYADDRVRSVFDIEAVIGFPVVGRVPLLDQTPAGAARRTEIFASIVARLARRSEFNRARLFLNTSSIPGEGKTFVTTHLARACAARNERVVIVDCDFYRPTLHEVFQRPLAPGLLELCRGRATLEEVVAQNVEERIDVVARGTGDAKVAEVINGDGFAGLLTALRSKYDRVFLDGPPMIVPHEVEMILSRVDAWSYTLYQNKTKRVDAALAAKRLLRSATPCLGAFLNGISDPATL